MSAPSSDPGTGQTPLPPETPPPGERPDIGTVDAVRAIAKRRLRGTRGLATWVCGLSALAAVAVWAYEVQFGTVYGVELVPAVLLALCAHSLARREDETRLATVALELHELGPEHVAGLLAALDDPDRRVRRVALYRLRAMVPLMPPGAYRRLSADDRARLLDRLGPSEARREPYLASATLRLIAREGGPEALPWVQRLARLRLAASGLGAVRRLAREVLPVLERHVATMGDIAVHEALGHARSEEEPRDPRDPRLDDLERQKAERPMMRLPFLLASWLIIVPYCAWMAAYLVGERQWVLAALMGGCAAAATQFHRLTLLPRHAAAAREIAALRDVHAVGRLAEAIEYPDPKARREAERAIVPLLRRLRATDAGLLDDSQRACLHRTLRIEDAARRYDLILAVLTALEQVGDSHAIPAVQRLADARPLGARQERIRDAARECLAALRENAGRVDHSLTLLRGAHAPESAADALLRPAASASSEPDQLLRAATGEETA